MWTGLVLIFVVSRHAIHSQRDRYMGFMRLARRCQAYPNKGRTFPNLMPEKKALQDVNQGGVRWPDS